MECDVEEFKTIWADMVSHYGLQTNAWVVEMYSDRERWAEAYLLGHFFAGMRSTQRCEVMNSYLNRIVTVRLRLFEFVQQYHRGLTRMRVADAGAETATEHSTPVLITQLKSLEKNGTEDSFEDARQVEHEMTSWMRMRWEMRKNKECNADIGEPSDGNTLFGVSNPPVVKTKGNPGKKSTAQHSRNPRKCSHCKCRGHDKWTCPKLSSIPPIDDVPI
ncbi:hypothetical protein RHMOL_Rhmol09G0008700 [Rhododendron molle]|uniref:Uncharacterized protein n=1 Tax=Rhododendron molle TaxID=49168 RepID=A0ACC0M8F6_RHOML|nr:hypothetical protein RHMOL_Rhmol09G0008700 [Rhododendron molle]